MTRTLATITGLMYGALGVAGIFDTYLVGVNGIIAADTAYSYALMAIAAALLFAALFPRETTRRATFTIGTLLALIALSGFLIAPERSEMFGMLANSAGHWVNLAAGLLLAGVALLERGTSRSSQSLRDIGYMRPVRHAMQ